MATKIGNYELYEQLGRGGYGTVYRAEHLALKVERAVKVLHPQLASDPQYIQRFQREGQLAARLQHPHIVPVYDLGTDRGRFYLAWSTCRAAR
jgi:serine/threonine protein kinase